MQDLSRRFVFVKKRVRRFIQTQDEELHKVTSVRVKGGNAYYIY